MVFEVYKGDKKVHTVETDDVESIVKVDTRQGSAGLIRVESNDPVVKISILDGTTPLA